MFIFMTPIILITLGPVAYAVFLNKKKKKYTSKLAFNLYYTPIS